MRATWIVLLTLVVTIMGVIVGCKDDLTSDECPVSYNIDTENTYYLHGKWQFVGFYDTISGELNAPLCGVIDSWIEFTDSSHTASGVAYKYPVVYRGSALINYFKGSYMPDTQKQELQLSETVKTKVRGTEQVEGFESRFHNLLSTVHNYHIVHNELYLVPQSGSVQMRFVAIK